jgi:chromosome segregation ATPase
MALRRNRDTAEARAYWDFVERTARDVASWPAWMRGEEETTMKLEEMRKQYDAASAQKADASLRVAKHKRAMEKAEEELREASARAEAWKRDILDAGEGA